MLRRSFRLIEIVCITAIFLSIQATAEPNFYDNKPDFYEHFSCISGDGNVLPPFELNFSLNDGWPATYEWFVGPAKVITASEQNEGTVSYKLLETPAFQEERILVDTNGDLGRLKLYLVGSYHKWGSAELNGLKIENVDCHLS